MLCMARVELETRDIIRQNNREIHVYHLEKCLLEIQTRCNYLKSTILEEPMGPQCPLICRGHIERIY